VTDGDLTRVGLVGPVRPFRGGVAQHTTALHRALQGRCELSTVSFARGYPLWLYPGRGNHEPGQADHREPGVAYLIEPTRPLSWTRAASALTVRRVDAVVLVWWSVFWAPCLATVARALRRRGIPVIFLCHNVAEHEPSVWKSAATRAVLSCGDAFIVHAEAEAERLAERAPGREVVVTPHPVFDHFPVAPPHPRRAQLELLFFGFVRAYKGLDLLVQALAQLGDLDVALTVAGEWWLDDPALRRTLERDPRVELIDRYLDEDEVAALFGRADAVVLPYHSATGTGVIPLAYHFDTPVVATRVGGLPDAVDDGATGLLVPPGNAPALASALRELSEGASFDHAAIERRRQAMGWGRLADAVQRLARGLR